MRQYNTEYVMSQSTDVGRGSIILENSKIVIIYIEEWVQDSKEMPKFVPTDNIRVGIE